MRVKTSFGNTGPHPNPKPKIGGTSIINPRSATLVLTPTITLIIALMPITISMSIAALAMLSDLDSGYELTAPMFAATSWEMG